MKRSEIHTEKIAEYLALSENLKADAPTSDYIRANALAWELAMNLPAELYRRIGKAVISDNGCNERLRLVIEVRKWLMEAEGDDLTPNEVIHHAPGIGELRKKKKKGGKSDKTD